MIVMLFLSTFPKISRKKDTVEEKEGVTQIYLISAAWLALKGDKDDLAPPAPELRSLQVFHYSSGCTPPPPLTSSQDWEHLKKTILHFSLEKNKVAVLEARCKF